jgi:hypothetical protein
MDHYVLDRHSYSCYCPLARLLLNGTFTLGFPLFAVLHMATAVAGATLYTQLLTSNTSDLCTSRSNALGRLSVAQHDTQLNADQQLSTFQQRQRQVSHSGHHHVQCHTLLIQLRALSEAAKISLQRNKAQDDWD